MSVYKQYSEMMELTQLLSEFSLFLNRNKKLWINAQKWQVMSYTTSCTLLTCCPDSCLFVINDIFLELVSGHVLPDIYHGHFSPMNRPTGYIAWNNCHESNFYLRTALLSSIQLSFEQRMCFRKCEGWLGQFLCLFRDFRHYITF